MSQLSDTQVVTASGGLVELGYSQITSDVNVVSTTAGAGTEIIAPLTVVCDGGPVLVEFFTPEVRTPSVSSQMIRASLYQDGAEHTRYWGTKRTVAAVVDLAPMQLQRRLTPTAGSHTFGVKAFVDSTSGTPSVAAGDGTSAAHAPAFLRVSKIVQATQWPAVTTGTIICTSTTRPSAPFVGQQIYETDTGRQWTYTGAVWVPRDGIFTNEAGRDAAITAPTEGMMVYLTAPTVPAATGGTTAIPLGVQTIWNGFVWVCVTPVGASSNTGGTTTSTATGASAVTTLTGDGTAISVTLVTGTTAKIETTGTANNSSNATDNYLQFSVSGATTMNASDAVGARYDQTTLNTYGAMSRSQIITGLTEGTNTFTLRYRVGGGTAYYRDRNLTVSGIA